MTGPVQSRRFGDTTSLASVNSQVRLIDTNGDADDDDILRTFFVRSLLKANLLIYTLSPSYKIFLSTKFAFKKILLSITGFLNNIMTNLHYETLRTFFWESVIVLNYNTFSQLSLYFQVIKTLTLKPNTGDPFCGFNNLKPSC